LRFGEPVHEQIKQGTLEGNGNANVGPPIALEPTAAIGREVLDFLE
jgi:hypothetical protein